MAQSKTITKQIDVTERAKFYNVCEMTVRRWIAKGADVYNLESVANHLLSQRAPSTAAMQTLTKILP